MVSGRRELSGPAQAGKGLPTCRAPACRPRSQAGSRSASRAAVPRSRSGDRAPCPVCAEQWAGSSTAMRYGSRRVADGSRSASRARAVRARTAGPPATCTCWSTSAANLRPQRRRPDGDVNPYEAALGAEVDVPTWLVVRLRVPAGPKIVRSGQGAWRRQGRQPGDMLVSVDVRCAQLSRRRRRRWPSTAARRAEPARAPDEDVTWRPPRIDRDAPCSRSRRRRGWQHAPTDVAYVRPAGSSSPRTRGRGVGTRCGTWQARLVSTSRRTGHQPQRCAADPGWNAPRRPQRRVDELTAELRATMRHRQHAALLASSSAVHLGTVSEPKVSAAEVPPAVPCGGCWFPRSGFRVHTGSVSGRAGHPDLARRGPETRFRRG